MWKVSEKMIGLCGSSKRHHSQNSSLRHISDKGKFGLSKDLKRSTFSLLPNFHNPKILKLSWSSLKFKDSLNFLTITSAASELFLRFSKAWNPDELHLWFTCIYTKQANSLFHIQFWNEWFWKSKNVSWDVNMDIFGLQLYLTSHPPAGPPSIPTIPRKQSSISSGKNPWPASLSTGRC